MSSSHRWGLRKNAVFFFARRAFEQIVIFASPVPRGIRSSNGLWTRCIRVVCRETRFYYICAYKHGSRRWLRVVRDHKSRRHFDGSGSGLGVSVRAFSNRRRRGSEGWSRGTASVCIRTTTKRRARSCRCNAGAGDLHARPGDGGGGGRRFHEWMENWQSSPAGARGPRATFKANISL